MKRTKQCIIVALVGLALCALSACDKSVKDVLGEYSYKISGTAAIDDTIFVSLVDEQGAMHIVRQKGKNVLLTMNVLLGGVYTADGAVSGDSVFIEQCTRALPLAYSYTYKPSADGSIEMEKTASDIFQIEVSGAGKVYDETIYFTLRYKGKSLQTGRTIEGENIKCVAIRN